jgi:predicted amidophosphoribosyltransferase
MKRSCSWCHRDNDSSVEFCPDCGHMAHVARMHCRCPQCTAQRERPSLPRKPDSGGEGSASHQ